MNNDNTKRELLNQKIEETKIDSERFNNTILKILRNVVSLLLICLSIFIAMNLSVKINKADIVAAEIICDGLQNGDVVSSIHTNFIVFFKKAVTCGSGNTVYINHETLMKAQQEIENKKRIYNK